MPKKKNGLLEDAQELVGGGVTLGMGSLVVAKMGPVAAPAAKGLSAMGNMLPLAGSVVGGKHVIKSLEDLF